MQKPNAILHMTGYGIIYGLLLAMLFIWSILMLNMRGAGMPLPQLFGMVLSTAYFALIFGGLPGAVMGFVEGWILWFLTRSVRLPITEAEVTSRRNTAFIAIGGLTFIGMGALLLALLGISFVTIIPPFIAGAAAVYAVHRYFLKLRTWGSVGKAKNKAKHAPTNQLSYEDAADDDALLADESHQQIEDTRR
jgi:hypothetical protein